MTLTLTAASALAQMMSGGSYAMTSSVQAAGGVSAANMKSIVGTAGQTTAGGPYPKDAYAQSAGFWFDDANANLTPNGCPLSFSQPAGSPLTSASPTIAVSADFNKDGKLDFAVTSRNANTVQVFLGNNNGGFAPLTPVSLGTPPGAYFLTAADSIRTTSPIWRSPSLPVRSLSCLAMARVVSVVRHLSMWLLEISSSPATLISMASPTWQ